MAYNRRINDPVHDDIQGILTTALTGVTAYTFRQIRTTGVVLPHVANGDIFSLTLQFSHRKKLGTPLDGVHIHFMPVASANGNIKFEYAWGWFNSGDTIPDTLPNTGDTGDILLATTDQYKHKRSNIAINMAAPASETYSSVLMIKVTRVAPAGTNWGNTNEIAILYMDAHFIANGNGSINENTDQ